MHRSKLKYHINKKIKQAIIEKINKQVKLTDIFKI